MNKLFALTAAFFASSAFAQTAPAGMVNLTAAEQSAYSASCTTPAGLQHSCTKGKVVAIAPDGSAQCRPDPKVLPFAKRGEKPCSSEKTKVAEATTPK